jgi:peptidoglycan biosynthesis protein MviN/MurJ (putative lipid II flippase)
VSPSKSRTQFVPARPRAEVITAVAVSASIVVGTALLIWLMRPGKTGIPGGGGLFTRQPRATMLVVLTAAALAIVVTRVLRGRRRSTRLSERGAIVVGAGVVVVLAVLGGIFWPGGVVRHFPKTPTLADVPTTNSIPTSTVAPSTTAAAPSTSPTTTG